MKNTKELILQKSMELFRSEGYDNVSVDRICSECEISKGAFYHHFKTKNNLLTEYLPTIIPHHLTLIKDIIDIDDPKEQLWSLLLIYVEYPLIMGPDLVKQLWLSDISTGNELLTPFVIYTSGSLREQNELVLKVVEICQKAGVVNADYTSDDLLFSFASALMGLSVSWASKEGNFDFKKELRRIFDTIFRK